MTSTVSAIAPAGVSQYQVTLIQSPTCTDAGSGVASFTSNLGNNSPIIPAGEALGAKYTCIDNAGNEATCEFIIQVTSKYIAYKY